jgi:flavin reductase
MSASLPVTAPVGAELRRVMRGVAATVTIVTTESGGAWYGMTATSFTSLALEPPSVLVAVNRDATLHDPLLRRGAFAVNVLVEGDEATAMARRFGNSAIGSDERFRHGRWRLHASGLPVLDDAQAWLVCRLQERLAAGTHTLVVGRVEDVSPRGRRVAPLVYVDGRYRRLAG